MTIWAILPAAGIGRRLGSNIPKQYLPLNGISVIEHSLNRLVQFNSIQQITVVVSPEDTHWAEVSNAALAGDRVVAVNGGAERNLSVLNGLHSINAQADDWVLVHDAVRPCVSAMDIQRLITDVTSAGPELAGGILASPMANTIKKSTESGIIETTIDREHLWNALTPQMFRYSLLIKAMESSVRDGLQVTDEASAMEHAGHSIKLVPGNSQNIKITHSSDLALAGLILKAQEAGL